MLLQPDYKATSLRKYSATIDMSGGRILETLESSVKLWGLLKEGIDLFESNVLKTTEIDKKDVGKLLPGA